MNAHVCLLVQVDHYEGKPPAAAFGVSAKFFADGRKQTARYHIGLRLPCATVAAEESSAGDAAARLAASGHAAATALSAPQIVHEWIDSIGHAPVGMGFGFAQLDNNGGKGGKIYVMNLAGNSMPELPLGLRGKSIFKARPITVLDAIPLLKPPADDTVTGPRYWLDSQMVSLEWKLGDDHVILRFTFSPETNLHGLFSVIVHPLTHP